jgi:putative redox protein
MTDHAPGTTVTAHLGAGTRVELQARDFSWTGNEPPDVGGTDTGRTPYELLFGSLAACIGATLRLYASHKGIPLTAVDGVFCDEREEGWIERIQTAVTIGGNFDEAQRKRLAKVAKRCPVHKTLANGVTIVDAVTFVPTA